MLRQLQQIPYIKGLVKQLRRNKDMRSVCGYQSKAPTEAHFSQMKKHIGVKGFTAIEMWLRHEAIRLRKSQPLAAVELVQTACVDGTYFPAWSNRDPHDTGKGLGDPDARLGRGKKGLTIKDIAYYFDTTRQTVCRWLNRGKHRGTETFQDKHSSLKKARSQPTLKSPSSS